MIRSGAPPLGPAALRAGAACAPAAIANAAAPAKRSAKVFRSMLTASPPCCVVASVLEAQADFVRPADHVVESRVGAGFVGAARGARGQERRRAVEQVVDQAVDLHVAAAEHLQVVLGAEVEQQIALDRVV